MLNSLTLGRALREIRYQRNYTLQEAAERAGMKKTRLADVEAGRYNPNFFIVHTLAEMLEITLDDLVERAKRIDAKSKPAYVRPYKSSYKAMLDKSRAEQARKE